MKIAFITLGYKPFRASGLDVSGERLVTALLEAGHEVTVIASKRGRITETHVHPALNVYRLPLGRSDWIGYTSRAARFITKLGHFDVVHFWDIHFGWAYRGRYVASLHQSFRQRINSLGQNADRAASRVPRYLYYSLARSIAEIPATQKSQGLLAVSSTTRAEFIQNYKVNPERIALARHGIDTDFFRPTRDEAYLRKELGLKEDEPVILFAGFITPRKGLEYLARALPLIRPRPALLLVGQWRSKAYRRQVLSLFGTLKARVVEAGFVPDEDLPSYYSLADVYVSPSLLEGFGLPLAEALACGTPVVTTVAGSAAEVTGPGGILALPRHSASLAHAISRLLQNPDLREEMGALGRKHVQQEFSLEKMLADTLAGYERFLG